jgi:leucyl-tRNA synthetase
MFAAHPEQSLEWSDAGVEGSHRFLKRLWQAVLQHTVKGNTQLKPSSTLNEKQKNLRRLCHETIRKVTDDFGRRYTFNTAIAFMMELLNALQGYHATDDEDHQIIQEVLESIVLMLSPITPHITHKLWKALGHQNAVIEQPWPNIDQDALAKDSINFVIQVNGKIRAEITVPIAADKEMLENLALTNENVKKYIEGKFVIKMIIVPHKLINIVVK